MTSERDLFQAILENPEEVALRLIYADWCDELGDPRGEFIRIQCELAEYYGPPSFVRPLRERETELLSQYRRQWNGEIHRRLAETPICNQVDSRRGLIRRWEYRRGFVEDVILEAEAFLEFPEAVFQIGPLRRVRFLNLYCEDNFQRVLDSPYLARLERADLALPDMIQEAAEHLIEVNRKSKTGHVEIRPVNCVSEFSSDESRRRLEQRSFLDPNLRPPSGPPSEALSDSYYDDPLPLTWPAKMALLFGWIVILYTVLSGWTR